MYIYILEDLINYNSFIVLSNNVGKIYVITDMHNVEKNIIKYTFYKNL